MERVSIKVSHDFWKSISDLNTDDKMILVYFTIQLPYTSRTIPVTISEYPVIFPKVFFFLAFTSRTDQLPLYKIGVRQ
jgi:hypothetical protein